MAEIEMSKLATLFRKEGSSALTREYTQIAKKYPHPVPTEVRIDEAGLIRRWLTIETVPTSTGKYLTVDTRIELSDFAAHPGIELPPRRQVLDYTPVLRAELGMMDGTSLGSVSTAAGVAPLPVHTFQRRAVGICEATLTKGRGAFAEGRQFGEEFRRLGPGALATSRATPLYRQMGRWLEGPVYRLGTREIAELASLAPPSRFGASYHHYLTIYVQQAEWALAEARAFQLGARKIPGTEYEKARKIRQKRELKRLAGAMGISPCERELSTNSPSQPA